MALRDLPFILPSPLEAALRDAYGVPPRAYHDFSHVVEVLEHFATVQRWTDPVAVALALLFHDAVYEPGRADNETRSAALAKAMIRRHLAERSVDLARVEQLILLTARHGRLARGDVDAEAALFLDCDMAILGSEPERYARYERAIATEYGALPRGLYRAGRAQFLRALLAKEELYLSELFHARLELPARTNLALALAALESPVL